MKQLFTLLAFACLFFNSCQRHTGTYTVVAVPPPPCCPCLSDDLPGWKMEETTFEGFKSYNWRPPKTDPENPSERVDAVYIPIHLVPNKNVGKMKTVMSELTQQTEDCYVEGIAESPTDATISISHEDKYLIMRMVYGRHYLTTITFLNQDPEHLNEAKKEEMKNLVLNFKID